MFLYNTKTQPPASPQQTQSTDNEPPAVSLNVSKSALTLAKNGQSFEVSVDATDNTTIARVEYLLDGEVVARSIEAPFTATIFIGSLKPGVHTLQAIAYDLAGNSAKSKLFRFTIKNGRVNPTDETSKAMIKTPVYSGVAGNSVASTSHQTAGSTGGGSPANPTDPKDPSDPTDPTDPTDPEDLRTPGGWWSALPASMKVCSNNEWENGPSQAPSHAIVVPAGNNAGFDFGQTNKTYWFTPGEHTFGDGEYAQIFPGDGSTYIGAPGAILDGKNKNRYAFGGEASNVRIAYLEIRNFGLGNSNNNEGVINHNSGTGWIMEHINAHHNDGAAVFIGTDNIVRNNCLKDNGQYGFSMYKDQIEGDSAIKNIVVHNNEIVGNNQDDWESQIEGCGCTGGGKFWDVEGATVTNNYVHDNLSTGLWADTNDIDFLFDSNWIEHNEGEGIWYEISYNATISRNVLKRNSWASGASNTGSPGPAIYISESGGDARLSSQVTGSSNLQIKNNLLEDNFSGVSIFENANRFCNSNGNTSKTYCTPFVTPTIIPAPRDYDYPNPINTTHPCYTAIGSEPYTTDCRWHSKNIKVFNNEFRFASENVPCAGNYCGAQALFATGADNISWDPSAYNVANVQNDVMFNNGNSFYDNTYIGNWKFAKGWGETIGWDAWRSNPYNQDNGSVFNGDPLPPVSNALDEDTATLEGSIGEWQSWFAVDINQTAVDAHEGSHSMLVTTTESGSWGVQLGNYPGFTTSPGEKQVSFWAKQQTGAIAAATLRVKWYDASSALIQTDLAPINTLTTDWQKGEANLTAPPAATSVFLEITGTSSTVGHSLLIDDITIADN